MLEASIEIEEDRVAAIGCWYVLLRIESIREREEADNDWVAAVERERVD